MIIYEYVTFITGYLRYTTLHFMQTTLHLSSTLLHLLHFYEKNITHKNYNNFMGIYIYIAT